MFILNQKHLGLFLLFFSLPQPIHSCQLLRIGQNHSNVGDSNETAELMDKFSMTTDPSFFARAIRSR